MGGTRGSGGTTGSGAGPAGGAGVPGIADVSVENWALGSITTNDHIRETESIVAAGVNPTVMGRAPDVSFNAAEFVNQNFPEVASQARGAEPRTMVGTERTATGGSRYTTFAGVTFPTGTTKSTLQQAAARLQTAGFKAVIKDDASFSGILVSR